MLLERSTTRLAALPVLLALLGGVACDENPCDEKDGYQLCGYCAEDVVLSSNPNAGKCRYCPTGSTCGDPCTMTDCGGGTGQGTCGAYAIRCGEVKDGIETVGGIVPESCACPNGTHQAGTDRVTAGGPYRICSCD